MESMGLQKKRRKKGKKEKGGKRRGPGLKSQIYRGAVEKNSRTGGKGKEKTGTCHLNAAVKRPEYP